MGLANGHFRCRVLLIIVSLDVRGFLSGTTVRQPLIDVNSGIETQAQGTGAVKKNPKKVESSFNCSWLNSFDQKANER